jgi:hypothetical protein
MIDTHWLQSPKPVEINFNDVTGALFNLYDIKESLSDRVKNKPLEGDCLGFTLGQTLDSVIEFLEQLEKKCTEVSHD